MKKMKVKGQKWLKGLHIFFACSWIGAGFCLIYTKAMNFWFGPIQVAALILLLLFRHTQDFKRRIEYGI